MHEFVFKKIASTKWITNKINGIHLIATLNVGDDTFKCSLADEKMLHAEIIIQGANSLEDVCLQLEHNKNPLHYLFEDEYFCVNHKENPITHNVAVITLGEGLTNNVNSNSILPEVHVPKKFSLKSN